MKFLYWKIKNCELCIFDLIDFVRVCKGCNHLFPLQSPLSWRAQIPHVTFQLRTSYAYTIFLAENEWKLKTNFLHEMYWNWRLIFGTKCMEIHSYLWHFVHLDYLSGREYWTKTPPPKSKDKNSQREETFLRSKLTYLLQRAPLSFSSRAKQNYYAKKCP